MTDYRHILAGLCVTVLMQNSNAAIFKCKNSEGKTVFQDKRCAESSEEEVISKPASKTCYSITDMNGRTIEAQNFWTEKQDGNTLFYAEIDQKKTTLTAAQIESMKVEEIKNTCAFAKLVNTERNSFTAKICTDIHYLTDKGESYLLPGQLSAIQACQNKIYADGFWSLEQTKYPIQSAYVSYSKQSNQLKVVVFPFMLTKEQEAAVLNRSSVSSILKAGTYAFGIILKLKEKVAEPQATDVIQFQSLFIDNQSTRVRSYDQRWQAALSVTKLEINKSAHGNTANISWTLKDQTQQAEVNVSAIMVEDNF